MRKTILTVAAAALGVAAMATSAMAFPNAGRGGAIGHAAAMPSGGAAMSNIHTNVAPNIGTMHTHVATPNVAVNAAPTLSGPKASATWGNHNWSHHNWGHQAWRGNRHYAYRGRGYGYGFGGLYAFAPDYFDYSYGNSCYQPRWVPTPYGYRWRDVWVCD